MDCQAMLKSLDSFIVHLRNNAGRSAHTCRAYKADLVAFLTFWRTKDTETPETPLPFKKVFPLYKKKLSGDRTPASTLARKISCLNTFLTFLDPENSITLTRPPVQLKKPQTISLNELVRLLEEIPDAELPTTMPHRDKCIIELLYATGIKSSELAYLRFVDLNQEERTLIIRSTKKKPRTVFFGPKAGMQLAHYLSHERPAPVQAEEYLLLNWRGQPLTPRSIQRICGAFGTLLKDKQLTPQILRNSFARHLLEQGTSIATVQQLLGHSTRISTERYLR